MANKRKFTTALVAGVTAAALMLGGTFAWTSISQQAKNEAAGIVNVGGRLHDDFGYASTDTSSRSINARSGALNKDVYVENFTDPTNGGQPIYARVKLTEYMEVGQDAGGFGADVNGDEKVTAVPVVDGTKIDDEDNWPVHIPAELCNTCATTGTCKIHDHWTWTMGGEGGTTGQTVFMPTFNKDKDSLQADINGTFAGTDANDKVYYDDYVEYTTDETGKVFVVGTDTLPYADKIYQKTDTAYYDDDTNTDENNHGTGAGVKTATETHTAKQTATAEVITMQQWIGEKDKAPGNYWVYDTDGWAYWANPIMPGEATGLLLDGIEMTKNPGEKCYYAINVVGQFATVGDWEYFNDGGAPSTEAMELLKAASDAVPYITVQSDRATVAPGETMQFTATVTYGTTAAQAESEVDWSLLNADGTEYTGNSTITDGLLTVADDEAAGTILTVVATSKQSPGAVGMKSVTVFVPDIDLTINAANGLKGYMTGTSYEETFTATVTGENAVGGSFSWSLTDGDGGGTPTESTLTSNGNTATLNIGEAETTKQIVVTATYTSDAGDVVSKSYTVGYTTFTTTDDLSATSYAVLTDDGSGNGTYDMTLLRTTVDITNDLASGTTHYYNGREVAKIVDPLESGYDDNDIFSTDWYSTSNLSSITVANTFKPTNLTNYFRGKSVKTIDLSKMDTSNVTNLSAMFLQSTVEEVILPDGFGSAATTMGSMFSGASSLKKIEFKGTFGGDNLTDIGSMFNGCASLETIDLSEMKLSSEAIDVYGMFNGCGMTTISVPKNIKIQETGLLSAFADSGQLTTIHGLETWDVSAVTNFHRVFSNCGNLQSVDLSTWTTTSATSMYMMFSYCYSLPSLDLSKFNLDNVTTTNFMFYDCKELTSITDAENWNVSNNEDMAGMFTNCEKLQLDCRSWSKTGVWENAPGVITQ